MTYETHHSYSQTPRWLLSQHAAGPTVTIDNLPSYTLLARDLCQAFSQSPDDSIATRWQERHYYVNGANSSSWERVSNKNMKPANCNARQLDPLVGQDLRIGEASRSHLETPHSAVILWTSDQPTQRSLYDKTRHSQETDIHASGRIRTRNHSRLEDADPHLRPRGHQNSLRPVMGKLRPPEMFYPARATLFLI